MRQLTLLTLLVIRDTLSLESTERLNERRTQHTKQTCEITTTLKSLPLLHSTIEMKLMYSPKKPKTNQEEHTIGEELYLVHLQRTSAPDPHPEDAEDDHDLPHPRKPNRSIGEELFNVHLKRSQGMEPDYDIEGAVKADDVKKETECPYSLRSKDKQAKAHHQSK